jgi:hypothetical protein
VSGAARPPGPLLRGALAGLAALLLSLVVVNLLAAPLLTRGWAGPAGGLLLVCALGPLIEELAKYGAFTPIVRPERRGWVGYWALGAAFGALEAPLKLAHLLGPDAAAWRDDAGALAALLAGALASLLLHTALSGLVARGRRPAWPRPRRRGACRVQHLHDGGGPRPRPRRWRGGIADRP